MAEVKVSGSQMLQLPRTEHAAARVIAVAETPSTNALAQQMVMDGRLRVTAGEVAVVATGRQTAGRGRLDHTWVSRPGESFTMSFVTAVPRAVLADESVNGWIQMIAGLAALDGIETAVADAPGGRWVSDECDDSAVQSAAAGRSPLALKWPNDVFAGGRKLGGILCQACFPGAGETADNAVAVIGIGLNLQVPADRVPGGVATSLHLLASGLPKPDELCDRIAAGIVASLQRRLADFLDNPSREAGRLRDELTPHCWTLGRRAVAHYLDGSELEGVAVHLNADASLTLRVDDGAGHTTDRTVRTADVGVLP